RECKLQEQLLHESISTRSTVCPKEDTRYGRLARRAYRVELDCMNWSAAAAVLLGLAVGLGAFGAHGLKGRLDDYSMGVYEKAVLYHFFHALGLLIVSIL